MTEQPALYPYDEKTAPAQQAPPLQQHMQQPQPGAYTAPEGGPQPIPGVLVRWAPCSASAAASEAVGGGSTVWQAVSVLTPCSCGRGAPQPPASPITLDSRDLKQTRL